MSELASYNLRSDQETFLEVYLKSGDVEEAASACGRKIGTCKTWMRDTKIQQVITRELKQRLDNGAIGALTVLTELVKSSPDPKIQLQAARDLLDRAGYKPEHLHTSADKRMEGANMQEMMDRIKELQGELGLSTPKTIEGEATSVQDVEPAAPPPPPTPDDDPDPPNHRPPQQQEPPELPQKQPKSPEPELEKEPDPSYTVDFYTHGEEQPPHPDNIKIEDLF